MGIDEEFFHHLNSDRSQIHWDPVEQSYLFHTKVVIFNPNHANVVIVVWIFVREYSGNVTYEELQKLALYYKVLTQMDAQWRYENDHHYVWFPVWHDETHEDEEVRHAAKAFKRAVSNTPTSTDVDRPFVPKDLRYALKGCEDAFLQYCNKFMKAKVFETGSDVRGRYIPDGVGLEKGGVQFRFKSQNNMRWVWVLGKREHNEMLRVVAAAYCSGISVELAARSPFSDPFWKMVRKHSDK